MFGEKQKSILRMILYITGLVFVGVIYGNSNNIETPYINRLFHGNSPSGAGFYWENIIIVIIIFILIQCIYDETQWRLLRGFFMKWLMAILFVVIVTRVNVQITKCYKSMQASLDCLYLERDEADVNLQDGVVTEGNITLENCSNQTKSFKVQITYAVMNDEHKWEERELNIDKEIWIAGHEKKRIDLSGEKGEEDKGFQSGWRKIKIYNEDESTEFIN